MPKPPRSFRADTSGSGYEYCVGWGGPLYQSWRDNYLSSSIKKSDCSGILWLTTAAEFRERIVSIDRHPIGVFYMHKVDAMLNSSKDYVVQANMPKEIAHYLNKMGARIPNIKDEQQRTMLGEGSS
ncbi:hypothetical protein OROMI_028877 [Orobanche minor]